MSKFQEALDKLSADFTSAIKDRHVTASETIQLGLDVGNVAISLKDEPQPRQAVIAAARVAFDKYVVPHDFPRIPEPFERLLDAALWQLVEQGIHAAFDAFEKATTPAPAPSQPTDSFGFDR